MNPRSFAKRFLPTFLTYKWLGVQKLPHVSRDVEVVEDGRKRRGRFFEVHIANGRFCGGGASFVPRASIDDGRLDVVMIDAMSLPATLGVMLDVGAAKITPRPGVRFSTARHVTVRQPGYFPIAVDGELYDVGSGEVAIDVAPGALDMLAP